MKSRNVVTVVVAAMIVCSDLATAVAFAAPTGAPTPAPARVSVGDQAPVVVAQLPARVQRRPAAVVRAPRAVGPRIVAPRAVAPRVVGPRVVGPRAPGPRVVGPGRVIRPGPAIAAPAYVRHHRPWRRRNHYGLAIGGIILGTIIAAGVAGAVPHAPPEPGLCWYWADPYQTRGYWDYCE
jgi:hypothetical protein